jgi:hypothetical protein
MSSSVEIEKGRKKEKVATEEGLKKREERKRGPDIAEIRLTRMDYDVSVKNDDRTTKFHCEDKSRG